MTKDWVHGVGHSPVYQILLQIVVRAVITSSPPAWTTSAGMLSTSADFPFFSDDLLRLWLQSVQYDLQHDFAWVADEADRSVVLALLQVAFLGRCDD